MSFSHQGAGNQHFRQSYSPGLNRNGTPQTPAAFQTPTSFAAVSSSPLSRQFPGIQAGQHSRGQGASPTTPAMPYNPQEWGQEQMGFHRVVPAANTRDATGMEAAMPSPPPPYSPDNPMTRPSPMIEQLGFAVSPVAENLNANASPAIPSVAPPAVQSSPSFPPPPGAQSARHRERSASGNRLFSSIQGLAGRGKQPAVVDTSQYVQPAEVPRPPASKRAASTGQIPYASSSAQARQAQRADTPEGGWQAGMQLPGPPPGPPPSGSRSQSLNRYNGNTPSGTPVEPKKPTRRAAMPSALGPVPPTPANWVDGDAEVHIPNEETMFNREQPYQPLRIDTGAHRDHSLTRRPATRDPSASGLRERRSRSKANRDTASDTPIERPADAVFSPIGGSISLRREHTRKTSNLAGQSSPNVARDSPANVMTPPYTPAVGRGQLPSSATSERPPTADAMHSAKLPLGTDSFYHQALERHRQFLEKEANAPTDEARLEAFANFLVHESRLRRDRYTAAYNAMAGEIVDLTRDMWRSYLHTSRRAATPTSATSVDPTNDSYTASDRQALSINTEHRSTSSVGDYTPATENGSNDGEGDHPASARQWGEVFKPSLSPIPSMAVSTVPDEDDSRGRAPSRWWEKSEASGSIGKPERIEKSHRETKYMGVNPALLRSSPQPSPGTSRQVVTPGASSAKLGPNEYPPEKTGWHDESDFATPMATPGYMDRSRKLSDAASLEQLDISRLVTLPPPYPRHHPAINNNHPALASLRSDYRQLAINDEVQRIRDAYIDQDWSMRRKQQEAAKQRRSKMRKSMQDKLNDGEISFADAAKAEAQFETDEAERGKSNARALFDAFETAVSHPLNTLVTERLATAERCMSGLCEDLEKLNVSPDPNRAQEEGDEHPERLEKLTLLKWLFEAREALHKEMFDLHAQRAEKYGEVVLTPYRIAKQQGKIDEAEAFFKKDGKQRLLGFSKDSLKRYEQFLATVEANVTSGVEDQLSAFWDIAPGLKEVIQQIPIVVREDDQVDLKLLGRLQIFVPPQEVEENPAYSDYPLQYLYSVLSHAQKSAYQFIESQTNLLCLLHEVRELTTEASLRVIQTEQSNDAGKESEDLANEMLQAKELEGKRLTADLKEKVGEVERQYDEALGERLENVKAGVKTWLEEAGGWEDGLDG